MAEEGYKVTLNVYDLSQGLARQLSTTFLGKAIDGIWHTGVVVYGNEYYFGGGIQHLPAGTTPYGTPIKVVDLGITHVPQDVFEEYLQDISSRYSAETYSLLTHNCNNFSNEVAQFLVGVAIPEYILHLPNEVMNSPMGALIMPMIQNLESTLRAGAVPQVPQFRPPSAQTSQTATVNVNKSSASLPSPSTKVIVKEANVEVKSDGVKPKEPVAPHDVKSAEAKGKTSVNGITVDPLGDARNKVQEEISREFAAIMASGTFRAGEAAALATKRVMQRYGHLNAAMPQS
ncbi:hypothetical protein OIU78_011060 [Salix suchowensis]|nr:desumoylating isopeptidase [Salix suchowensis]KAJ6334070.1 hypothetical protein OIU78_011060 [Salix suchowensis]KAJ6334071.1 hypothetical protein OIU78_011060 [Salix suchowensis]